MHSRNDPVVPPVVLGIMQQHIPVPVETVWFDESGHSMLLDVSGSDVASAIANFFQNQLPH
jgi:esterase/lipase